MLFEVTNVAVLGIANGTDMFVVLTMCQNSSHGRRINVQLGRRLVGIFPISVSAKMVTTIRGCRRSRMRGCETCDGGIGSLGKSEGRRQV